MQSKNILYIVSGPSGSGKTTTMRKAMSNEVVSFTTRDRRYGEIAGVDYVYITQQEFDSLMQSGGIAEHTTYYGTASYGITMEELTGKLEKGNAFVIVDVVGKEQLEKLYPNTISIFFNLSKETAVKRMKERGDTQEAINKRLKSFDEELDNFYLYDYVIDNENTHKEAIAAVGYILDLESGKDVH